MNLKEEYSKFSAGEKKVDELYHKVAVCNGLSDSVLWILYCLADDSTEHTQRSIAVTTGMPQQTINSAINHLAKEGYVYLEKLPVGKNNKSVRFTPKGRELSRSCVSPLLEAEERAFNRLTDEEKSIYLSLGIKHTEFLQIELRALIEKLKEEF